MGGYKVVEEMKTFINSDEETGKAFKKASEVQPGLEICTVFPDGNVFSAVSRVEVSGGYGTR